MMIPLLLAAVGVANQDQFTQPLEVPQTTRLELSPTLDGKIGKEEWDPYGNQTYLQWEPGRLYIAGQMPAGKDLVLSIDGKGDGWLVGHDNIEFRVSVVGGKAVVKVRELDATVVKQPVWKDRPDLQAASSAVAGESGGVTTVEAMFDDAGLKILPRDLKSTLMMRLDTVDSAPDTPSYVPRVCSTVRFDNFRVAALPANMDVGIESWTRAVIPGEDINLRLTFHGTNALGAKSMDLRTLGEAEDSANRMAVLFPAFDNKNRAFVDYKTRIDPAAAPGYRIVRGSIGFKDGPTGLVEASYRIAPYFDFNILKPKFERLPEDNTIRVPFVMQTYTKSLAKGILRIVPPQGWQITKGDGQKFSLYPPQGSDSRIFEMHVPADAHGTFAITITGETDKRTVSQICYVTIR